MNTEFEIRINHFYSITEILLNMVKYYEVPGPPIRCVNCATVLYQLFFFLQHMFVFLKKVMRGKNSLFTKYLV